MSASEMFGRAVILLILVSAALSINVGEYLYQFGYVNTSDSTIIDLQGALTRFQDFYGLPSDGSQNDETIELMNKPRCGVADPVNEFQTFSHKWNKTNLTWHFPLANRSQIQAATKAFDVWQNKTNLVFHNGEKDPDIIIKFGDELNKHGNHADCMGGDCPYLFDGPSGVLGHAYFPRAGDKCIEIHLDRAESWYYEYTDTHFGKTNFIAVLLHEIGHTLGLQHSSDSNAVMNAYYRGLVDLNEDDILGVRSLYGDTTPDPPRPSTEKVYDELNYPDLCNIQTNKYLITHTRNIHIFYNQWIWILKFNDRNKRYGDPEIIRHYLQLDRIENIFQKIDGDFIIFDNDTIYEVDPLRFSVKRRLNITTQFGLRPRVHHINCVFSTYSGRTYLFYNDKYYIEINECTMGIRARGAICDRFPGIPNNVSDAFRYINGNLYFFQNNTFYEFNEFENRVLRTGESSLTMFGIRCEDKETIYSKIKDLLGKLVTL